MFLCICVYVSVFLCICVSVSMFLCFYVSVCICVATISVLVVDTEEVTGSTVLLLITDDDREDSLEHKII